MKPKSKIEHAMLALAEKLPPITEKQRQYALNKCLKKRAIVMPRKRVIKCLCCGQNAIYDKNIIDSVLSDERYDCPFCGRIMLAQKNSPSISWHDKTCFVVITTFKSYQVARVWEVSRYNYKNENYAHNDINEIFQIWITPEGKEVITGRQLHRSFNYTEWDFHKPLGIRKHNSGANGYFVYDDIYDISGYKLYPNVRVTALIKRNGWHKRLLIYKSTVAMTDAMRWLLKSSDAEMLVKTRQDDLFLYLIRHKDFQLPFLHSVRIANRNAYIVQDAQMWLDMLKMAADLGKDTHNPKIVCPTNLTAAHDALLAPARRLAEKRDREKKHKEALEWESLYKKAKAPYLGIRFGNDKVTISVLQSVADIEDEGKAMHHCVFDAGYYKRDDSLILSARDNAGNRLETIELSLKTCKVIQSRARFNHISKEHDEIVSLVNNNMALFRQAQKQREQVI